jgi:hypothetical protein
VRSSQFEAVAGEGAAIFVIVNPAGTEGAGDAADAEAAATSMAPRAPTAILARDGRRSLFQAGSRDVRTATPLYRCDGGPRAKAPLIHAPPGP